MQKKSKQMIASPRVISFIVPLASEVSKNNTTRAVEMSKRIGISFLTVSLLTLIGQMRAATPTSNRILMILLPMTLPSSISVDPEASELMETASSGALVPKATTVRPMRTLLILKLVAIEDAPDTNQSAPLMRTTNPIISNAICKIISIFDIDYVCIGII